MMRTETPAQRQAAAATLKEVMSKLEEALRLSRELEEQEQRRERAGDLRAAQDELHV